MELKPIQSTMRAIADGERRIEQAKDAMKARVLAEISKVESNPYMGLVHRNAIVGLLRAQL